MGNWNAINLRSLAPTEITTGVSTGLSLLEQYLTAAQRAIDLAKQLQAPSGSSPDILTALVEALSDTLTGLLQLGKVHVLFVPMAKTFPAAMDSYVPATLDDLQVALGINFVEAGAVLTSGANRAYTDLVGQTGGNKGFFSTFTQTLLDEFDVNRPQYFNAKDAVAMAVLMVGASSFSELVEAAASFNRVFRPAANADLTARTIPTPQNLRARVVGHPKAKRVAVRLDWDPPQTSFASPYFPGVTQQVKRYAVIRSRHVLMQSATSVLELFDTRALTQGMTSTDAQHLHQVVTIGSGANSSYLDTDEALDPGQSYYYAIAWEIDLEENGQTKIFQFDRLSNVVKTRVRVPIPTQNSTPPDWTSLPSALDLVPDLASGLLAFTDRLQHVSGRQAGGGSAITQALSLAEANLNQLILRVDDLSNQFKKLTRILAQPLTGLHSTVMAGLGGNAFLIGELAARLNDRSDGNRPPFDANEYVIGVCIVAGGPRLADVQPIIDFISALFGPSTQGNPLLDILNAVGGVVTQLEGPIFGPNMQPLPPDTDPTSINPNTGLPIIPPSSVVLDNGTTATGTDPANPNAGVTGRIPDSELC